MSHAGRRQTRRGDHAFTLVELVIVMVIVAIAFFAVQPSIRRPLQANRERAGLRRVVAALTAARARSVGEGRLVRVIISPQDGVLWAEIQADPWRDRSEFKRLALLGRRETKLSEELAITQLEIGGGDEWQADQAAIYFYPDGRTTGADLMLAGASGQEFYIQLLPATGRVRVET